MTGARPRPPDWGRDGADSFLQADFIFDGERLVPEGILRLQNGKVELVDRAGANAPLWRLQGIVAPGFVDLQVNGGGGVLFNADPTPTGCLAIASAHRSTGTAALLPTVISDAPEVIERAADAVITTLGQSGVAGIHIEGPHISTAKRGTHAAHHLRPLDNRTMAVVRRLRDAGVPVMMTVAPEVVPPEAIRRLADAGVIVALGHSDARATLVRSALGAGARTFTHLFNAMSQMQGREPGMVGAAINSDAYAAMICDGIHVAPEMLALAIRARPVPGRMYYVTDAMPTVAGPTEFQLYDRTIRLQDSRLVNSEGALAGAHVTMHQSLRLVAEGLGLGLEQALRMGVSIPASLMGLPQLGQINGRAAGDLMWLSPDLAQCGLLDSMYRR